MKFLFVGFALFVVVLLCGTVSYQCIFSKAIIYKYLCVLFAFWGEGEWKKKFFEVKIFLGVRAIQTQIPEEV